MNTRSLIATGIICATVIATAALLSNAGPLSPPAGPIAPTNKTLSEVEPRIAVNATNTPGDNDITPSLFKISQPGSYYLTGNITGVASKNGIEIAASNVTLDLNGFTLQGVAGSLDGVFVSVFALGVAVENGVAAGWGGDGVDLLNASKSTLRSVRANGNGLAGLTIGFSSVVDACVASGNGSTGISTGASCTIANSSAEGNSGSGISASTGVLIIACAARSNALFGVFASSGSHVSQSTAASNTGDGFFLGSGSVISGCSATSNGDDGIAASSGGTIVDNAAAFNTGDGIQASGDSLVRGNACASNGSAGNGAGIHTISSDNRVEGNSVTDNDRGIDVDSAGNFIVSNSASGNTINYDIVINNKVGLIVAAPNSLAISGSTGGAGLSTTRAWANFSF